MSQLSRLTQQNASASEELAATSQEMSGQAQQLQQTMAFFKVSDGAAARDEAVVVAPVSKRSPAKRSGVPVRGPAPFAADGAVEREEAHASEERHSKANGFDRSSKHAEQHFERF